MSLPIGRQSCLFVSFERKKKERLFYPVHHQRITTGSLAAITCNLLSPSLSAKNSSIDKGRSFQFPSHKTGKAYPCAEDV